MIDEKLLLDRLTDAAAAQDDLLPRAVAEDLAAGRRRLRRRRFLAAGTALVAAGAVAVATVGMNGVLEDTAQPEVPIATQTPPVAKPVEKPVDFDALMKSLMYKHFDPTKKHLNFTTGPFEVTTEPGYRGTLRKVGWNAAGDKGQGMFLIGLERSAEPAGNTCGSFFQSEPRPVSCRQVTLPNGRPAMIGRQGRMVEFSYVQPDGEFLYVAVDPVFRNNTTTASKKMTVTDSQLFAFATDPALNLPPVTSDNSSPLSTDRVMLIAAQHLPGRLTLNGVENRPGDLFVNGSWMRGMVRAEVEVRLAPTGDCRARLAVPSCVPVTLPNGPKGEYYEGARTYQGVPKYVMGATYKQPDGDVTSVRILYMGRTLPADAITKAQILALVSDRALDK